MLVFKVGRAAVLTSLLFAFAPSAWSAYRCTPNDPRDCRKLNEDMTQFWKDDPNKRDQRTSPQLNDAVGILQQHGIEIYWSYTEAVSRQNPNSMREFAFQEWIRNFQGGMPWLPLSWGYGNYPLYHYTSYMPTFEQALRSFRFPLSDENLLITYLFTTNTVHATSHNYAIQVRELAKTILNYDSGFGELRLEVHEAPSALTIRKIDDYLKNVRNGQVRDMILELRKQLETLFGGGDVDAFLGVYSVTNEVSSLFSRYRKEIEAVKAATSADRVAKLLQSGSSVAVLRDLSEMILKTSAKLRAGITGCQFSNQIDCTFEYVDLLSQLNNTVFSLSNQLIGRLREFQTEISVRDFLEISLSLARVSQGLGFSGPDFAKDIEARLQQKQTYHQATLLTLMSDMEKSIQGIIADFRGQFMPLIAKYKAFTGVAEMYVDDSLRSSSVLPLANLVSVMKRAALAKSGLTIFIDDQPSQKTFQVLNPGIAHGPLIIPTPEAMNAPGFEWNPEGIYILAKTPGSIEKVAGILTGDAGSMISHVQLLASNAGLPNVFIAPTIIEGLRRWEGQDVLLITLPNGEAQIKPWKKATAAELAAYNEYYKVKTNKRMRIPVPENLRNHAYPIRLEDLRMVDAGKIAGGKATGQAEVSSISGLNEIVPRGFVLPFGVYFEHMQDSGVYDFIKQKLADPKLAGEGKETTEARKAALAQIRERIAMIELKPEILATIFETLMNAPYSNEGQQLGVFVRSDTNAEDLPGFVGAGLNQTIGNVTTPANVAQAIKTVWASPFRERAFTWRQDLLENPWDVLPSVVVQIGVEADKAGVMIVGNPTVTDDIEDTVYIAANEGLGFTTVGGEFSAEELTISRKKDYEYRRHKRAYALTKYIFRKDGAFDPNDVEKQFLSAVPVTGLSPVVTPEEAKELARIGDAIQKHIHQNYGILGKWDLEWCIKDGKVVIVQLRAFNGNKLIRDTSSLGKLQKSVVKQDFDVGHDERAFAVGEAEAEK
ncbi:MAG: PEP/pyruvate-binding domain-containing protein [Bacteriovoracia bacterium]